MIDVKRVGNGDSYSISMLKYAMTLLGKNFGPPRAPMRQLTSAEQSEIEQMMKPILGIERELQTELTSVGLSAR